MLVTYAGSVTSLQEGELSGEHCPANSVSERCCDLHRHRHSVTADWPHLRLSEGPALLRLPKYNVNFL